MNRKTVLYFINSVNPTKKCK